MGTRGGTRGATESAVGTRDRARGWNEPGMGTRSGTTSNEAQTRETKGGLKLGEAGGETRGVRMRSFMRNASRSVPANRCCIIER